MILGCTRSLKLIIINKRLLNSKYSLIAPECMSIINYQDKNTESVEHHNEIV